MDVKYKKSDIIKTAHLLDPVLLELDNQLSQLKPVAGDNQDLKQFDEQKTKLLTEISKREQKILPVYHQVACSFADLHDTPGLYNFMFVFVVY